jgi:hypothetical protein
MKNRLFPILMGISFILIVGVAFFLSSEPQTTESVVNKESVQEIAKPTGAAETEDATIIAETTIPQTAELEKSIFGMDIEKAKELLNSEDFENFKGFENAEDSQKFLDKLKSSMSPEQLAEIEEAEQAAKNWFDGFGLDGFEAGDKMPDMDMQELYDILGPAFGGTVDFSKISTDVFRKQFPEGEPADYEPQMAERIHKIVSTTSGNFEEVTMQVMMKLATDEEYIAWTMGQFQGKIGQQIEWMKGAIITAGQMEGIEYTVPEDMSQFVNPLTKADTQESTTSTQTPQDKTPQKGLVDVLSALLNKNRDAKALPAENISSPLPPARIAAIRETLSRHGTEAGMQRLLENDKEAANWLLREFKTPSKINEWLSQQRTKTLPRKIDAPSEPPETQLKK